MVLTLAAALGGLAACSDQTTTPEGTTALASVVPQEGSTGVSPTAPITIRFTHAMMAGMEQFMALHEGPVTGTAVEGSWSWNAGRTEATFTPRQPLKTRTQYTIHVGGGMKDANGRAVDMQTHMQQSGCQWATAGMMTGGMMGGQNGQGMMGPGWQHANGSYGMVMVFTTA